MGGSPGRARRAVRRRAALLLTALGLGMLVLGLGAAQATPRTTPQANGSHAGALPPFAPAVLPSADKATRFQVDFVLNRDGSVEVTENITWQFPGDERHGIERLIKVRAGYQEREDTYREYEMSDVSATSPSGAPDDVSVSQFGAYQRIRVGSPSETVSGVQSYVVKYTLANYVNSFPDHAEFYFNLIDPSNENDYANVSARVTGPAPIDRVECFYGELGSSTRCEGTAGATATFTAPNAQRGQGVSILASLPRTAFDTLEPDLREGGVSDEGSVVTSEAAKTLGVLGIGAGVTLPLLAAGLMGALVYTRGRDEQYAGLTPGLKPGLGQAGEVVKGRAPTVAVQFTPPEGVQPGMLGTIVDESANTVDVAATVVDLAVRGFLTMEETQSGVFGRTDWRLTRTSQDTDTVLHPYESALLTGIFSTGDSVLLSDLKNHFSTTLKSVQEAMYAEVVQRGWFRKSPQLQRGIWTGLGKLLVFGGFMSIWWIGGGFSAFFRGHGLAVPPGVVLGVGIMLTGAVLWFMGKRMAARTADGSAVLAQSLGFRQYLVTAEANQIRWEEAQEIFSRYLPYAIVFGVAERWAGTFEKVAEAAAAAGHSILMPTWYIGHGDFTSFGSLASGMDSFATTAGGTFTSTPGSSGSSGFSSGGGFSGGGGGGSSGGSW
jgi:Predicted membrane protein (DUF2207)